MAKIDESKKADDEAESHLRKLRRHLGRVMREVFWPDPKTWEPTIWNEAGAVAEFTFLVECAYDGIREEPRVGILLDKRTLDELFDLADQWNIISNVANEILKTAFDKRNTGESES
jgi:hypothetical protein